MILPLSHIFLVRSQQGPAKEPVAIMAAAAAALLLLLPLTAEAAQSGKLNVLFLVAVNARQPPWCPSVCFQRHAASAPP